MKLSNVLFRFYLFCVEVFDFFNVFILFRYLDACAFSFASVLGAIGVFALAARFALTHAGMFAYGNTAFVVFPERDYFELNAVDVAVFACNFNEEEVVARGEIVYAERSGYPIPVLVDSGVTAFYVYVFDCVEFYAVNREFPVVFYFVIAVFRRNERYFNGCFIGKSERCGKLRAFCDCSHRLAAARRFSCRFFLDGFDEKLTVFKVMKVSNVLSRFCLFRVEVFDFFNVFLLFRYLDDRGNVTFADVKVNIVDIGNVFGKNVEGHSVFAFLYGLGAQNKVAPNACAARNGIAFHRYLTDNAFVRFRAVKIKREVVI